jgi:hypothetical protein
MYLEFICFVFSGGKLWDHVGSYFQSLPPTPVHDLTVGNVYLGKKLIQDEVSERSSDCTQLADGSTALAERTEGDPVFDDTDSVSSQDHSYLELIRDYTSTTAKKLFGFGEKFYSNSESSVRIPGSKQGDKISDKHDFNIQGHNRQLENNASASKFQEQDDSSSDLPDTVQTLPQVDVNNANSNLVPHILSQEPKFLLSWKNLESLDTTDLVENAQKLLESVNKTLYNSETVASRLEDVNISSVAVEQDVATGTGKCNKNTHVTSNTFLNGSDCNVERGKEENAALKGSCVDRTVESKSVVRCKSEDVPAAHSTRRTERKLSTGRRRSVTAHSRTSLERRYSSDVSTY